MNKTALLAAFSTVLGSCVVDNTVDRLSKTEIFLQEPNSLVDILFVVDSSPSMADEQQLIADGFESFIGTLEESNADFQLGVIDMDMDLENSKRAMLIGNPPFLTPEDDYIAGFKSRVKVGVEGSDKEKGLSAAYAAVTEPLVSGQNGGFVREDANLVLVFVSDEEDCSDADALAGEGGSACYDQRQLLISVKDFIQDFSELKSGDARVVASAIVGPKASEQQGCQQEVWPGNRYRSMAVTMGGIVGNICNPDYSGIMEDLGLAVAGEITVFNLAYAAVPETIEVTVDDEIIPESETDGWIYDAEYRQIRFDGSYVPPRGSGISVSYEILGPV